MKMIPYPKIFALSALTACLLSSGAMAHPGHGDATGWAAGFSHPLFGWDHVTVMVAVGLWAAQQRGAGKWVIPSSFLALMTVGAVVGIFNGAMPGTEVAIGLSVVLLGGLVLRRARVSAAVGGSVVGSFAVFHGLAHGAEMAKGVSALYYGAGFLISTALLHLLGFVLMRLYGSVIAKTPDTRPPKHRVVVSHSPK